MSFKPMLAYSKSIDVGDINLPVYGSVKLDGIRAVVRNCSLVSRNLLPIANEYVYNILSNSTYDGLDGEIIIGSETGNDVFNRTTSLLRRRDGEPDFTFHVFDIHALDATPYEQRLVELKKRYAHLPFIKVVEQREIGTIAGLQAYEEWAVNAGYEGLMLRSPKSVYKFGRSTLKEHYLLKWKRFEDSEAVIIGFEEQMHNANEATKDALGRTERSSHKENLEPMNTLGSLTVRDLKTNVEFSIGTGFTADLRQVLWGQGKDLIGQVVKYKFQPHGVKEAPRFPVFIGFRAEFDLPKAA